MTSTLIAATGGKYTASPFTDADICTIAVLALPDGTGRPRFDEDVWDFTEVIGLPVQMGLSLRVLDFTRITDPAWRLVAKELIAALLAPRHPAVATLPRALRTALHLRSCGRRLAELVMLFTWLPTRGVTALERIDTDVCEAYLAHRRYVLDEAGVVVGEQSPATRRSAAQVFVDLVNYRELFTIDRVQADLRPFGGATASAVAEMPSGRSGNKTQPVSEDVLAPMLAAALYLVDTLGPHAVELAGQVRDADARFARSSDGRRHHSGPAPVKEFTPLLAGYVNEHRPLPMLPEHHVANRIKAGWPSQDPLLRLATGVLARQAGLYRWNTAWLTGLRDLLEAAVGQVGIAEAFARDAAEITSADGATRLPWTTPLHRLQAVATVGIVRTATLIVTGAVTGMRASELMELRIGCRRPPEQIAPGLVRHRVASKVVKGQPLGGTADEWVVVDAVDRAIALAEQLHTTGEQGALLFGRFAFDIRYEWFRNWVNADSGRRLGLAPIPGGPMTLRMLRRTLALEMAYRPGGVLATKIHLKHVAVATTEGYSSRPGGAQGELLAEVNKHEADRNLELVLAEFRNYQQGILPAGPGARALTEFFASIDGSAHDGSAPAPTTQRNDRDILNLLSKRAKVLHLGPANYCWFTDPSRALCLKLAGTPGATRPLVGMCDSARCPQATHHQVHRSVWAEHAENTKTFLGQLGKTRTAEHERLTSDHARALRVIADIDTTASKDPL
jgi:integrase